MEQAMAVLTSRRTTSWYTPPWAIEMARTVLGAIDLDPASAELPQTWIKAGTYYTLDLHDMPVLPERERKIWIRRRSRQQLDQQPPWRGRVWLNPPFDDTAIWVDRLLASYSAGLLDAALLLINSNLGYAWYERLWRRTYVCCVEKRMCFVREDGITDGEAKRGQTFAYVGPAVRTFTNLFRDIGRIIPPE